MGTVAFSLVLPCFNEQENIARTVRDMFLYFSKHDIDGEVIVVDDGSTDDSVQILRDLQDTYQHLLVFTHPDNRGYGATIQTGCDNASGTYIGFMDSDGQFAPEDFTQLFVKLTESDFVAGYREKRADPFMRTLNASLYHFLVRIVLGIRVRDMNCAMKVFLGSLWPDIRPQVSTGALFNAEMFCALKSKGMTWVQVPVSHYPRTGGHPTGASPMVILNMFCELLTLSISRIEFSTEWPWRKKPVFVGTVDTAQIPEGDNGTFLKRTVGDRFVKSEGTIDLEGEERYNRKDQKEAVLPLRSK